MTWELAASGHLSALSVSAGHNVLALGQLSARDLGGLAFGGLILLALYLLSCLIWPYGPCLPCRYHPRRNPGSNHKRHGRCKVCRGSGERLRVGTRVIRSWRGGRWPR